MPFTCPQCGAHYSTDETCEDRFHSDQLAEHEQPGYGTVHHLSVPCYMLQHNAYSRAGWLWARDLLFQFVYHGLTPETARRRNRINMDSGHRKFSITRGPKLPGIEDIGWKQTIGDVRLDSAEGCCADVLGWAKSILADSEELVRNASEIRPTSGGQKRKR